MSIEEQHSPAAETVEWQSYQKSLGLGTTSRVLGQLQPQVSRWLNRKGWETRTGLSNHGFTPLHLHLIRANTPFLNVLICQIEFERFIVEHDISHRLDSVEILQETIEIASIANVLKTNREIVVDRAVLVGSGIVASRSDDT